MHKAIFDPLNNAGFRVNILTLMMLVSSLFLSTAGQAADPVGALKFTRGDVTVKAKSGETRKAAKGDNLMQHELIVTGATGIAVIRLSDDSRMTLRPNSEFRVNLLNTGDNDSSSQPSMVLNLLRGGLRLVTGLFGKANPAGYRLSTPIATIGIRGTEFNTRICTADCAAEEKALAGSDAAGKIQQGLYVNVDEGKVFLKNFATSEPLNLSQGESGYVADLYSLPVKLSLIPAFQALDKMPSPSELDFDDIQISDHELRAIESAAAVAAVGAVTAVGTAGAATVVATGSANEEKAAEINIAGTYEIEVEYGSDLPHADRKWFFGSNPDIEFTLTQKGDKIKGEFEGDRDGTIEGKIDDEKVTFKFVLEALGGEYKDGAGTWIVQEDGSLQGDFKIRDQKRGVIRGRWILTK